METWVWIAIGVVVAIVVLGVLLSDLGTRRTRSLQDRFGREYDRTIDKTGGRREADQELVELLEVDGDAEDASTRDAQVEEARRYDNVERLR